MRTLCIGDNQRAHLAKLVDLIQSKQLNGSEAWSAFSAPALSKTFQRNKAHWATIQFSEAEVRTYKALRQSVQNHLFQRCAGSCSYCRHPVGHYGWAWHIEHVLPKSKYGAHTFDLANLTVGCVHCNQWKGSRVDKNVTLKNGLPIINPVEAGFRYSDHLRYVQVATESISFARYAVRSNKGRETYQLLSFDELERAHAINGMDGKAAALHERITNAMQAASSDADGIALAKILS